MANCLERLLYELVTNEHDPPIVITNNSTATSPVENLVELVKLHHLDPNYVFSSQYAVSKRCYGKPLLYLAVMFDQAEIVKLLLSKEIGASPNCSREPYNFETLEDDPFKRTAIFHSLSTSRTEIFNMLLNAPSGCDALTVDAYSCSLLWHAVNMAHYGKIHSILSSPFGPKLVNLPDRCGLRPLHIAAINNDPAAAELLLNGGAAIDETQYEGATALCIAAKRGAVDVLKTLLLHGANPNHSPVEAMFDRQKRDSALNMTQDYFMKTKAKQSLITPGVLAIQSGPFRKTPEQINATVAILLSCGAVLPRSCALPSHLPQEVVALTKSPANLQIMAALSIRKALLASGRGRSVKQLSFNLIGIIPEPLIRLICFDFLNQF